MENASMPLAKLMWTAIIWALGLGPLSLMAHGAPPQATHGSWGRRQKDSAPRSGSKNAAQASGRVMTINAPAMPNIPATMNGAAAVVPKSLKTSATTTAPNV